MDNYQLENSKRKHFSLLIPSKILIDPNLSLNEKLILGIDYTFQNKLGYNSMLNSEISDLLQLHPNIISKARKKLVKQGILIKEKRIYRTSNYDMFVEKGDSRDIVLPFWIYNDDQLSTGAKILWGEYNSLCMGYRPYFAGREFTARKLSCSVESISNWTRELNQHGFLKSYIVKSGFCTKQKQVVTCSFSKDGDVIKEAINTKDTFKN